MSAVRGIDLWRELNAHAGLHGVTIADVCEAAGLARSYGARLARVERVDPARVDALRRAMAVGDDAQAGAAIDAEPPEEIEIERPASGILRAAVAAEAQAAADRTMLARRRSLKPLTIAERLASACAETPGDAVLAVQRRWPATWARVIAAGRVRGCSPGAAMVAAIEAGLEALGIDDFAEEAA